MKTNLTGYRLQVTGLIAIILLLLLYPNPYTLHPSFAQTTGCTPQTLNPRVQEGLISTPNISTGFGNPTGTCIVDPNKAPFAPFKIPGYDDLKSIYFNQSKATKVTLNGDQTGSIDLTGTNDKLYHITGNLTLDNPSDITGNQSGIIFVDDKLSIGPISGNKLNYGNNNSGLVFVVKGDVIIDKSVTQIDAVIISAGKIYTAGSGCSHTSPIAATQLVVNGSLVSLSQDNNIEFCRALTNNSQPAEQINNQPKYLVILRNLYANTFQK